MSSKIDAAVRRGEYGKFTAQHLKTSSKGIRLFNERKFWECHEELEDHWIEDVGDNARYVYWAIIQVAASLYHLRNGNMAGARGMILKAQRKIEECQKRNVITELMYNHLSWKEFSKLILDVPAKDADLDDFTSLEKFRFSDPDDWRL